MDVGLFKMFCALQDFDSTAEPGSVACTWFT